MEYSIIKDQDPEDAMEEVVVWMACTFNNFVKAPYIISSIQMCLDVPLVKKVILSVFCSVTPDPMFPGVEDPARWSDPLLQLLAVPTGKILDVRKRDQRLTPRAHYSLISDETEHDPLSTNSHWVTLCSDIDLLLPDINKYYVPGRDAFYSLAYVTADKNTSMACPWTGMVSASNVFEILEKYRQDLIIDETEQTGISMRFHLIRDFLKSSKPKSLLPRVSEIAQSNLMFEDDFRKFLASRNAITTDVPTVLVLHGISPRVESFHEMFNSMLEIISTMPEHVIPSSAPKSRNTKKRRGDKKH